VTVNLVDYPREVKDNGTANHGANIDVSDLNTYTYSNNALTQTCLKDPERSFNPSEQGNEKRDADVDFSARYWDRHRASGWSDLQMDRRLESMKENILSGSATGSMSFLVGDDRITDEWREKLSAYRVLARQMGFDVGAFRFNPDAGTVTAPITKRIS